jgi:hypothetical protein
MLPLMKSSLKLRKSERDVEVEEEEGEEDEEEEGDAEGEGQGYTHRDSNMVLFQTRTFLPLSCVVSVIRYIPAHSSHNHHQQLTAN